MAIDLTKYFVDPEGQIREVAPENLGSVKDFGYRPATIDDIAVHNHLIENPGIKGAVKVGLKQMINQFALNVPETIENYSDSDLEKAQTNALKKEHAIANLVGGGIGFIGSMLTVAGPLARIGSGAGRLIANNLGRAAIDAGVDISGSTLAKTGAALAGKVAELGGGGAAMMAPQALTESYFGDHQQAAESLLAGGGLGVAIGGALKLAGLGLSAARKVLPSKGNLINKAIQMADEQSKVDAQFKRGEDISLVDEALTNASEENKKNVMAAANRINIRRMESGNITITPTPGMLATTQLEKGTESSLTQMPTIYGGIAEREQKSVYGVLQDEIRKELAERSNTSSYETGSEIQSALARDIGEKISMHQMEYGWIKENYDPMPFNNDLKQKLINKIKQTEAYRKKNSSLPVRAINMVEGASNFGEFRNIRTDIGRLYNSSSTALDKSTGQKLYSIVNDFRDKFVENMELTDRQKAELLNGLYATDASYAGTRAEYEPILEALGGTKANTIYDIADKITSNEVKALDPSEFSAKLFNRTKIDRLRQIKETFPEVWDILRNDKLNQIYTNSFEGKDQLRFLSVQKFFNEINKIPKEIQFEMFGEGFEQRLKDLKTVAYSIPGKIGASDTPRGLEFLKLFSVEANARDLLRYNMLHNGSLAQLQKALPLIEKGIKNTADNLGKLDEVLAGKKVSFGPSTQNTITSGLSRLLYGHDNNKDHADNFDQISKAIVDLNTNPNANHANTTAAGFLANNGAPDISQYYQQQIQQCLKYLHDMMPKNPNPPSLFGNNKWRPSDIELSKFNRILQTVDDPFSIIDSFQKGNLTSEQVQAFQANFPTLYGQVKNRILKHATNPKSNFSKMPYNRKLQLGILLNDRTIDNNFNYINGYQSNFDTVEGQEPQAKAPRPHNYKFSIAKNTGSEVDRVMYRS